MRISNLKTDHLQNPLGYRISRPVFTWLTESDGRTQTWARIEIAADEAGPRKRDDRRVVQVGRIARAEVECVAIDLPDTVRRVREDLLPLVATLRGTTDVLSGFTARSLLGGVRRRPDAPPTTPPVIEPD